MAGDILKHLIHNIPEEVIRCSTISVKVHRQLHTCHSRYLKHYPAGTWRRNDVILTTIRRHHVALTSVRRHFYVMCVLRNISEYLCIKEYGLDKFLSFLYISVPVIARCRYLKVNLWNQKIYFEISIVETTFDFEILKVDCNMQDRGKCNDQELMQSNSTPKCAPNGHMTSK